jgi:hypothetical protein
LIETVHQLLKVLFKRSELKVVKKHAIKGNSSVNILSLKERKVLLQVIMKLFIKCFVIDDASFLRIGNPDTLEVYE